MVENLLAVVPWYRGRILPVAATLRRSRLPTFYVTMCSSLQTLYLLKWIL